MGNKLARKREGSQSAETAATAEEPADTQPAEESEVTATLGEIESDVVVGEPVAILARLPAEECVSECKQAGGPAAALDTQNNAEPKPVATETLAPVEPELLLSKSEPAEEPKPVAEAQLAPEPEPTSHLEPEVEAVAEPISEPAPAPAEALEQQTDTLTRESPPKPVISSPALIDLSVSDVTLRPPTQPSDIPLTKECQDSAEAAEISAFEPEKPEETSESLEEPTEAEENLEQLVVEVNEDSVSRLLKNLELQGNDLVTDLIPSDVNIPDDTPITDICRSTELM